MRILGSPYNSEKLNNTQKIWLTRCISKRLHSDKYAKAAHGYRALFDDKMSGQKKSPSGIALSKRILILPAAARTMALQTFDNWSATSNFQREATPDGDAMTTLALSFLRDYPELKK